jgi:hypothetical protein
VHQVTCTQNTHPRCQRFRRELQVTSRWRRHLPRRTGP